MKPSYRTNLGCLYEGNCIDVMSIFPEESIDMIFADPPFNLSKKYASGINDNLPEAEYIKWSKDWMYQAIRLLKPGGAFFVYNKPEWNLKLFPYLSEKLQFKNLIAVDIKQSMPIKGRLYPAHYSLLYMVKSGGISEFHPDRIPVECCRKCGSTVKDYGGHLSKLNPKGLNLSDVWTDISPVRHSKYKTRVENQLPLKLVDRIVSISTTEHSVVLDPFVGSGTTAIISEFKKRHWIGIDLHIKDAITRFQEKDLDFKNINKINNEKNLLFKK